MPTHLNVYTNEEIILSKFLRFFNVVIPKIQELVSLTICWQYFISVIPGGTGISPHQQPTGCAETPIQVHSDTVTLKGRVKQVWSQCQQTDTCLRC